MTLEPRVFVSVLNWNGCERTLRCIASLLRADYSNMQIVVVDNDSADESVARIATAYPDIPLVCSPENLGYAGGHRLCMEKARAEGGDLLWLLNNDLEVKPDTLTTLVDAYMRHGPGVYGSVSLVPAENYRIGMWVLALDGNGRPLFNTPAIPSGTSYEKLTQNPEAIHVANVSGSSLLLPLSVIAEHGFIDESFFLYGEEVDYCLRLAKAGIPSYIVPLSVVHHSRKASSQENPRLLDVIKYYRVRNRLIHVKRQWGLGLMLKLVWKEVRVYWKMWLRNSYRFHQLRATHPEVFYKSLGIRDALIGRMGKTFAPEDFWQPAGSEL